MTPVTLPFPALVKRYTDLKDLPSAKRLLEAETVTAAQLAEEFTESVAAHAGFDHVSEPFYPDDTHRDTSKKSDEAEKRTFGWSMALKRTTQVAVVGAPDLNFRYIDREIIPTRTQHRPTYEEGVEGKQVRVDLVLANALSKRPIIGELKIAGDKDPYTGLVQALAGASQLVSPAQRERLKRLGPLASAQDEPLIDVYVLLGEYPKTGRDRFTLLDLAVKLASQLEAQPQIRKHIGRICILSLSRNPDDNTVSASTDLPKRAEKVG
jgi:hypothetical protein